MKELFYNQAFLTLVISVVIFGITQGAKYPYKRFLTSKITDERKRRMANAAICIMPFALGILFEFLVSHFHLHDAFTAVLGIGYGSLSTTIYAFVERFFKVKIENPYDSYEGRAVLNLMGKVSEDGKVDSEDGGAIKEFFEKIKNG
jgi:MFS family permease